jgi:hypothetical protein
MALVILLGKGYCMNLGAWVKDSSTDFFRFFLKFYTSAAELNT